MGINRRQFLSGAAAIGTVGTLASCETNKATGRQSFTAFSSLKDDIALGKKESPKLTKQFGGEYNNPRVQTYVQKLGEKLSKGTEMPDLKYTFTILDTPIVNAFALPGGFVFVSRGLLALASNEAELAGVLSHELGHVTARHVAERVSTAQATQIGLFGLSILGAVFGVPSQAVQILGKGADLYIQGFSREQEMESDVLGVRYMSKAGYDPQAMVSFLKSLRQHSIMEARLNGQPEGSVDQVNYMATHPRTRDRVKRAIGQVAGIKLKTPILGRQNYLNAIDGITFGDNPNEGIIFGRSFKHPQLRLAFEVPEGFRLTNTSKSVMATHKNGSAIVFDGDTPKKTNAPLTSYITRQWATKLDLTNVEGLTVNGMPAATAKGRLRTRRGMMDIRLLAIQYSPNRIYRFQFVTPPNLTAQMDDGMKRTTYSFQKLTYRDTLNIHPMTINIMVAQPGQTAASLSSGMPFGKFNEDYFRLLNDLEKGQPIPAGQPLKVVL